MGPWAPQANAPMGVLLVFGISSLIMRVAAVALPLTGDTIVIYGHVKAIGELSRENTLA